MTGFARTWGAEDFLRVDLAQERNGQARYPIGLLDCALSADGYVVNVRFSPSATPKRDDPDPGDRVAKPSSPAWLFDLDGLPAGLRPAQQLPPPSATVESWSGGFAFAIWDSKTGTIHAYRDHHASRPLYYHSARDRLLVSSALPRLTAYISPHPSLDERSVSEFLHEGIIGGDRTIFRGIARVPAASRLIAGPGGVRVERYWSPWPGPWAGDPTRVDREFRTRFEDAVKHTLSDDAHTGVLLSGGPDSGVILGMATRIGRPHVAITAVSERGGAWDESAEAREAAAHHGVPWRGVPADPVHPLEELDAILSEMGETISAPNLALHARLLSVAADEGCEALLDGHDADLWFMPSAAHMGRLLLRARAIEWYRTSRGLVRDCGATWREVVRASLRGTSEVLRGGKEVHGSTVALETEAMRCLRPAVGFVLEQARILQRMKGVDEHHPFFDPTLVRFLASIPIESRMSGGEMKILLRRALDDLLPPAARGRRHKPRYRSYFDWSLREHCRKEIERLASDGSPHLDPFWNRGPARNTMRAFLAGSRSDGVKTWRWLVYERWCMLHSDCV